MASAYMLLFLLILLWGVIYYFNGRTILSPSLMANTMFILSTCVFISAKDYFGYTIRYFTVMSIILFLAVMFIGERLSNLNWKDAVEKRPEKVEFSYDVAITKPWLLFLTVIVLAVGFWCLMDAYKFSLRVGNTPGNYFNVAKYVRNANHYGDLKYSKSSILAQLSLISEITVYFSIYCFCYNLYVKSNRNLMYLLPVLAYSLQIFSSDNRTGLLKFLGVTFIIVFVFMKYASGWKPGNNKKIIIIGMCVIVAFLGLFRWLGYRTEASLRADMDDNFSEYMSASIVGIDHFFRYGGIENTLFGEQTFKNVYNILRQWGLSIPVIQTFEEFFNYAHGESNIYTGIKALIIDFTYVGALLYVMIYSYIVTGLINRIKCGKMSFMRVWFTGYMFYPIVMFSIANVMSAILSMSTVYMLVYVYFIPKFFKDYMIFKEKRKLAQSVKKNTYRRI